MALNLARNWTRLGPQFLPFADAATPQLPLDRLLRLSLFQVSVGMALALLVGTLNRVMIVELHVSASLVSFMVALPLVFAPLRALIGFRSDTHRSVLGWRRVPYIWFGSLLQFGGFAFMPFALIVLSGDTHGPIIYGQIAAALAFLLVGAGLHTTQTVGLALATDLAPAESHPRVVALMCTMLLLGVGISSIVFGALLHDFSQLRLIKVIQGTAAMTMLLNIAALWKQEARDPQATAIALRSPGFHEAWLRFRANPQSLRRLSALGIGTVAFGMQDILLEPYGGEVLKLPVAATTLLTALLAATGLAGFVIAARALARQADPYWIASLGALGGVCGITCVSLAAPLHAYPLFGIGTGFIGFGGGLFAHSTLTAAMRMAPSGQIGLALGAWGAVQATASGGAIAVAGVLRDSVNAAALDGRLGQALTSAATGYELVYTIEIVLLFATLAVIGPLVRHRRTAAPPEVSAASNPLGSLTQGVTP